MAVVLLEFLFSGLMLFIIGKCINRYNINDIILGLSFLTTVTLVLSGGFLYYFRQNYPYYEEVKEEVEFVELEERKPVKFKDKEYICYVDGGESMVVSQDCVEIVIEDGIHPCMKIYEVTRHYQVKENRQFSVWFCFLFSDYSRTLDEYIYEIYLPKSLE